jgi:hypothetical protein
MAIIGIVLIVFGVVDLVGSFAGFDVWGDWIGVNLPEIIWRFTAWVEIGLGYVLFKAGSGEAQEAAEEEA